MLYIIICDAKSVSLKNFIEKCHCHWKVSLKSVIEKCPRKVSLKSVIVIEKCHCHWKVSSQSVIAKCHCHWKVLKSVIETCHWNVSLKRVIEKCHWKVLCLYSRVLANYLVGMQVIGKHFYLPRVFTDINLKYSKVNSFN